MKIVRLACLVLLSQLAGCTRSEVHGRPDASAPGPSTSDPQGEAREEQAAGSGGMAMSKPKPAGAHAEVDRGLGHTAGASGSPQVDASARPANNGSEFDIDSGTPGRSGPSGPDAKGSCVRGGACRAIDTRLTDAVDLLFMVDNSNSMAGEQASLKSQFPTLIRMLTLGNRSGQDPRPFLPVRSLHVGVVSSDMGLSTDFGSCHANGGDDGRLQNTPRGLGCGSYPSFLSYDANQPNDPEKFGSDVGCIATLGTGGCGFEQQLEAPLKALWPSVYRDAQGVIRDNPVTFLSTTPEGKVGHGDVPAAMGGSLGFLQADQGHGPSLLVLVALTDEEDCSVRSDNHLWPNNKLPTDSPYIHEDINLRCMNHPEFLYDVKDRYYTSFRALRPGHEDLVVFAAIAGVPDDMVDPTTLAKTDFSNKTASDQFYDTILNDPRMQQVVDPSTNPGMGTGNIKPSCSRAVTGESQPSTAYPPRRLVQLAKLFGENGMVQSICQDDFWTTMYAIVDVIAKKLGQNCSLEKLSRQGDKLDCDVVWELPATATGPDPLTDCSQRPFLEQPQAPRSARNAQGGRNCVVKQLPVSDPASGAAPAGDGWFYDDFTHEGALSCRQPNFQRIAFTRGAQPAPGVKVVLDCQPGVFP